jgi:hypothetical protein
VVTFRSCIAFCCEMTKILKKLQVGFGTSYLFILA